MDVCDGCYREIVTFEAFAGHRADGPELLNIATSGGAMQVPITGTGAPNKKCVE